ncbi:MAG: hypothetical protein ACOYCB_11560 [Fastidiosipilaceae bacterium]|jgi:hypothetical protein
MKHSFVYLKLFEVNGKLVTANNIDEAIAIWREANEEKEVKGAHICRDGEYVLSKIPTEQDIKESFRE